jgi:hypothetical protein
MKEHNGTETKESGNLGYMDVAVGLGRHHRHTAWSQRDYAPST